MSARRVQKLEHRSDRLVGNDFLHIALSRPETSYLVLPASRCVSPLAHKADHLISLQRDGDSKKLKRR